MITSADSLADNYQQQADVVIVGSGAGGATAAYYLARSGIQVVVLEEGQRHHAPNFQKDPWLAAERMYRDKAAFFTIGTPPIPLPLGRALGGTTTINSGTCFRLPKEVFSRWKREYGLTGFSYEELIPIFEEIEHYLHVYDTPLEQMGANNRLFYLGAKKLGMTPKPIRRNASGCRGAGLCVFGCPNQAKQSVDLNFVVDASKLGAHFITSARVDHILVKNNVAGGVSGKWLNKEGKEQGRFTIQAPVTILSAGAIYTPYLLLQNKLANGSGEVGKNLRLHPAAKVVALFEEDIKSWQGVPQALYVDDYASEGIMFEGFFLPPSFLSIALPFTGIELKEYMSQYNKMAGFGVMVTDTSQGRVYRGWGGRPLLIYHLNATDTARFVKGIEIATRVYLEAGARQVLLPIHGMPPIEHADQLAGLQRATIRPADLELSAFHPLGTCRMGDDPKRSVVNAWLETHQVKNLYIADASVFPGGLGVNPQITIMAFAARTARHIANWLHAGTHRKSQ